MPSLTHEALVQLFRNRPELAPELLRDALRVPLPVYAEARVESADLSLVAPAEYRADLVVLLVDGTPVLGIVVEVQLQRDDQKLFTWPVYLAAVRARFQCDACVLVVTPTESVATWAAVPIAMGPGSRFTALVVGPRSVPIVRDVETAARDPELAVLSAMAHGKDEPTVAVQIALAACAAAAGLDDERALLYSDLVRISLGEAARNAFEDLMATGNYEYQSDFARKHRAEGLAEGEARGEAKGEATAIVTVLDARAVVVTTEQKAQIFACTDLAILERWLRRAVSVASADELFVD